MERLPTATARNSLAEVVNRAAYARERVVLTRRGKAMAAVVPIEGLELLEELERRVDLDAARAALEEARTKGTSAWNEVKATLGL